MFRFLERATSVPSWLTIQIAVRGMPTHPWYRRYFSLEDWHAQASPLCRFLDAMLWIYGTTMLARLWKLLML